MIRFACPNAELDASDVVVGQRWSRQLDGGVTQTVTVKALDDIGNVRIDGAPHVVSVGDLLAYWEAS